MSYSGSRTTGIPSIVKRGVLSAVLNRRNYVDFRQISTSLKLVAYEVDNIGAAIYSPQLRSAWTQQHKALTLHCVPTSVMVCRQGCTNGTDFGPLCMAACFFFPSHPSFFPPPNSTPLPSTSTTSSFQDSSSFR